jgi:hypothetical protein
MAYPTIDKPYGLKPVNLLGGQVFSGSTRSLPIAYGYNSNIFYGDFVQLTRGSIVRQAVIGTTAAGVGLSGVFLGCSFTNPITKQKQFSQYWPAGTLAGDAVAVVCDDPDTVFKAVVCSATTVVGSANLAMIGQNMGAIDNSTGDAISGNSRNALLAVVASGAPATTTGLVARVVDVVRDTAFVTTGVGSSSTTAVTLTTGVANAVVAAAGVSYVGSNGQVIETGSFITGALTAGATSATLNLAVSAPNAGTTIIVIPSASTILFTQYPEVLVKLNFGVHQYYTSVAA